MATYTKDESRDLGAREAHRRRQLHDPVLHGRPEEDQPEGIRHDIALAKEHGFIGTLGVVEVSITLDEYVDFVRISKEEAGDDFFICTTRAATPRGEHREARTCGGRRAPISCCCTLSAELLPGDRARGLRLHQGTFCDATNLAIILFPMSSGTSARACTLPTSPHA